MRYSVCQNYKILALIPARANSKGLPGKNVMPLAGKPLIQWSIDAALQADSIDRTVVTTDCKNIAQLARMLGAETPFIRPAKLAYDNTPGIAPVLHACQKLPDFDIIVVLQPTSPLRTSEDIDLAVALLNAGKSDFCMSVTQPKHHPNWLFTKTNEGVLKRYETGYMKTSRQALTPVYAPNGAIYAVRTKALVAQRTIMGPGTLAYEMSPENSWDIDSAYDMKMCEYMLADTS